MKKNLIAAMVLVLSAPSLGFAGTWRHEGHRHGPRPRHESYPVYSETVVYRKQVDKAAVAAGVLGGVLVGVILDRVITQRKHPKPVYSPPPPPAPEDPYDRGYEDGYERGVEDGHQERYESGRQQGYEDGYEDGKTGRSLQSSSF